MYNSERTKEPIENITQKRENERPLSFSRGYDILSTSKEMLYFTNVDESGIDRTDMMAPCAAQRSAAETPSMAPAKTVDIESVSHITPSMKTFTH